MGNSIALPTRNGVMIISILLTEVCLIISLLLTEVCLIISILLTWETV